MFNIQDIQDDLFGLVSWRNHYNSTEVTALDPTLTATPRSGLYFQDGNQHVNLFKIKNTIPESMDLDDYLTQLTRNGISKVFTRLFNEKKLSQSVKSIVEKSVIYDGWGNKNDTIISNGSFVGFEIDLLPEKGIETVIHRIGLQFTAPQTDLPIYLYHTSSQEFIKMTEVTTTTANTVQWINLDWTLKYFDKDIDAGGSYIIGYFQDDISGLAIKKDFDFRIGPCQTCSNSAHTRNAWQKRMSYLIIRPIYFESQDLNGDNLPNLTQTKIDYQNNFGLNLDLSTRCELSQLIKDNELVFAELIRSQVQLDVMVDMKNSTRLNAIKDRDLKILLRELEGDKETHNFGLAKEVDRLIKGAKFDLSRLNSVCVPCDERNKGISHTSAGIWNPYA